MVNDKKKMSQRKMINNEGIVQGRLIKAGDNLIKTSWNEGTELPHNGADSSSLRNIKCKAPEAGDKLDGFEEQEEESVELEDEPTS